jgi:hypothetical protein
MLSHSKDKIKLSLPFNNERHKINEIINDLKQAVDEMFDPNLPEDLSSKKKP